MTIIRKNNELHVKWRFEAQDFESGVFGAPVGRVVATDEGGEDLAVLAKGWADDGQWLVSSRMPFDDEPIAQQLYACDFTACETLITLERDLKSTPQMPASVRLAEQSDRSACLDIARTAFTHDRFHADARIPNNLADRLKETWVVNALNGRADAVLVVEDGATVAGFVTCMVTFDVASIDLIGVATGHQGRGLGKALVQGALAHYAGRKKVMRVGTQDSNENSLSLYEGQGFQRKQLQVTYHWINDGAAP